ncbi:MAG: TetR/AcrR family transcriptional regulator [Peptococcaceae bacterium]|nr:TetR/AcrR family transcriptional regulator [Peptococcaceae bacterium]
MNKRPDITDMTRAQLVEAFCHLYKEAPVEKITVKQITELAGYNRITFYRYFKDVYDILDYVEDNFLSYAFQRIAAAIQNGIKHEEFIDAFIHLMTEKKGCVEALMSGSNVNHTIEKIKKTMVPAVMKSFGISEEDLQCRYVFEFYVSGVLSVCSTWLQNGYDLSQDRIVDVIEGFLKGGALPQIKNIS